MKTMNNPSIGHKSFYFKTRKIKTYEKILSSISILALSACGRGKSGYEWCKSCSSAYDDILKAQMVSILLLA